MTNIQNSLLKNVALLSAGFISLLQPGLEGGLILNYRVVPMSF